MAIIPAGGSGRRMQGCASKQYLHLNGLPILVHTLLRFQSLSAVDAIYLVVPEGDVAEVRTSIVEAYALTKVTKVIPGGRERQDSVGHAVYALEDDVQLVAVHDGVRPFVTGALIHHAMRVAATDGAAVVAVPAKETVKIAREDLIIDYTPLRDRIWITQTPQVFRREILIRAYERAFADGFYGTDDAGLVERMGVPVRLVHGSYDNIKITIPDDLVAAEALMKKKEWSA